MSDLDIIKEFPMVYGSPPYSPKESLLCFGFECGTGWYDILYKLSKDINEIVTRDNLTDFRVVQVKEKFGTLRYYTNHSTDDIYKLIREAENKSEITCEKCGASATLSVTKGWYEVLCEDCKNNKLKKYKNDDI